MKELFLIRHAKSSWSDSSLDDIDRPLNGRGRRDAPFMGQLLKGKGFKPAKLVSSPANRAFSTAKAIAAELDIDVADIQVEPGIYEAWTEEIMTIVRGLSDKWPSVALFGHNPTFTNVANLFAEKYIPNMPTCSICRIESSASSWKELSDENSELTHFFFPKQYFS